MTYEEPTGFYSSRTAMSSLDETWATPKKFFQELNEEFQFTLDAAALKSSALCESWYGPDHDDPNRRDAFQCDWHKESKSIYLNPPYGRGIGKWMAKAFQEAQLGGGLVVCLVPARTDTAWFQDYCLPQEVRFIRGRLKFNNGPNAAPFPSAVIIFRGLTTALT